MFTQASIEWRPFTGIRFNWLGVSVIFGGAFLVLVVCNRTQPSRSCCPFCPLKAEGGKSNTWDICSAEVSKSRMNQPMACSALELEAQTCKLNQRIYMHVAIPHSLPVCIVSDFLENMSLQIQRFVAPFV